MAQPSNVSPAIYRHIVDQVADALIFADRDGIIRVWNTGAETLFGFSAQQALGASLDLIIDERFRAAHWHGYRLAMQSGQTSHGAQVRTTRAMHQDGRKLYVEISFAVVCDEAGAALGSVAMGRDGTARYLATKAARKRQPD